MEINPDTVQDLLRQMDEEVQILVLVTGTLSDGSEHYAYASIPPSKYQAFKAAEAKGNYDLAAFGNILRHGEGKTPPADVMQEMEEQHGADHMFEAELEAMIRSNLS